MKSSFLTLSFLLLFPLAVLCAADKPPIGVPVSYQLPTDGPLPQTYLVTLAIVEAKNPDWIVSQFACGVARTVTAENGGKFSEDWDGLDDNFMPVLPGDYTVRGIYAPARKWKVDGEWHAVTPKFAGGASPWLPSPDDWQKPEPFGGDPVGSPMRDVAVGSNGIAVFYYQYLENGTNLPMFDLNKPVSNDQFLRAFNSGGAGGGPCVATDGESVWAFSTDGGPKYVYRADGKSFGVSHGANRSNGYLPAGWVTAIAAWRDRREGEAPAEPRTARSFVYVAQRGKIEESAGERGHYNYRESTTDLVNKLTVHDGANGKIIAEVPLAGALGLAVRGEVLYALQAHGGGFVVSSAAIVNGLPGAWQRVFAVPANITPADLEVDSHGRFYLSDSAANKVFQLDAQGKVTRTFGRQPVGRALLPVASPEPKTGKSARPTFPMGTYDPQTFMAPEKLATWKDASGEDRLIVVEQAGPNRVSEWSANGKLLREFMSLQTYANDGYGFDPEHPEHVYLPGKRWTPSSRLGLRPDPSAQENAVGTESQPTGWMTRFKVNYATREWTVDAVWPFEDNDPRAGPLDRLQFIRTQGRVYLAGRRSFTIYRFDGDKLLLSAGILRLRKDPKQPPTHAFWHDANGNGRVDDDEIVPTQLPGTVLTYHGQNWLEDLSLLAPAQGGQDVWRLAPSGFDPHGNPIFKTWTKVLTDPIFAARAAGKADSLHGGNELAERFVSDWMGADGSPEMGFYVQARGGKNFSANEGPQHKITRYVPDGRGGYAMKWRTGRSALDWLARPGEMYGAMRIQRPINGLLSVIDQSRCGILLYTDDGLYVDTLFPDGRRFNKGNTGLYPQPGEFFAGQVVPNRDNGRIYLAMGKYTPLLYEVEGWSLHQNPVRRIEKVQQVVSIAASQIASPPEIALSLRGGAGAAKLARFAPGLGEPAFDGSLVGWESCEPIAFQAEKDQSVEVRCLYQPDRLLLRWHARLGTKFTPKPLPALERIFTHDQLADTLSFYIQSDKAAKPVGQASSLPRQAGSLSHGRPGDARFVFGIFQDSSGESKPVAVGLHAEWQGRDKPSPQVYRTPVGEAKFAHVGAVESAQLAHRVDDDGKGFVLVAAIPRAALPRLSDPFAGGFRTLVNFEATFGGHNKFWWANSDGSASRETFDEPTEARLYPGSWSPAEFTGLDRGIVVRHWLLAGPFGGPGAEKFKTDPNGVIAGTTIEMKKAVREFCEAARYPLDDAKVDLKAVFTGDQLRGYWPDPRRVSWKAATIEPLDTRVICGNGGQVWYGATWVYAPSAVELDADLHSHPQTELRWTLNGEVIPLKTSTYQPGETVHDRQATQSLALRAGWNEVRFRGYCYGYNPFRVGLVLKATEEKLWPLKLSATPPAIEGRD